MFSVIGNHNQTSNGLKELSLLGVTAAFTTFFIYNKIRKIPVREASLDWGDEEDPIIEPYEEISPSNQIIDESNIL